MEDDMLLRFRSFVGSLSESDAREQLVQSYLQFERCMSALRGDDVSPASMMDNGSNSGEELFYMCKKLERELSYLEESLLSVRKNLADALSYS